MRSRRADWLLTGVLAALSYTPLFLSRPGMVAADTKQYLYLDPTRLTSGAASMWDPNTGLGTVTHQNIGYLLPMGPYYSLVSWLGIPMWVGQRIWMGTLMLAAGLGVAYCARRLGLEGPGRAVAALAYALSPYILDYLDRISAILMPWAALGWMIGLTITAARTGRWRHPALFALVVALVGGVNATSILLVLAAPALWLAYAVWVSREVTLRRALATSARLGLLCTAVSLWWAAGLWAEGRYGINILRVTETVPTVARTSSAAEVLRGLGYWYFYGWDKVQPWTQQAVPYTQSPWLLAVSFVLPGVALLLGLVARWTYRAYCLGLVGLATVVAVGAFPYTHPSLFGAVIKGASAGSTLALAMRSVDRIVPLVVIGLALLMGSGISGLGLRRPSLGLAAGAVCTGLVAANLPALWTGGLIAANLSRPSKLPSYWTEAASYLNSLGPATRVLGLPGEDFAAYSWGVTQDPVPPGLLTRPYVSRQVVPAGSPASANLLQALDEPIQEGTFDPAALAPVARLMSVGQILLQSDLQYERYHLPLPQVLYRELVPPPAGVTGPTSFGAANPAPVIRYPLDSEARLGLPTGTPQPPALSVFNVSDPRPLVRAEDPSAPLVVAGDGSGVVEAADAGLLAANPTLFYAASMNSPPPAGATLVVTDTNPLASYRWGSLRDNVGAVQQPGAPGLTPNPSDYTLPLFPHQSTADQTVAQLTGVKSIQASQYGDSLSFTPENAPTNAFDGDPSTAWSFGAHESVKGIRIETELQKPVTTDHVTLTQVHVSVPVKRRITKVTLLFDHSKPVTVQLGAASLSSAGQTVSFPARTFSDFELVVDGATGGAGKRYDGLPPVGFSAISIPQVPVVQRTLRLPTDLLGAAGAGSLGHPLDLLMERSRAPQPPRHDPEPFMSRTFQLPTSRTFSVSGTAEINEGDSDYLINQLIGLTPTGPLPPAQPATTGPAVVVAANSSSRLVGDRSARANQAVDGNPHTAWIPETGPQAGKWMSVTLDRDVTFDHLDLQVVNDGRHSLPSRITVSTASGSRTVDVPVPAVGTGRQQGSTTTVPVSFPALTGRTVKVTIDSVRPVRALDYYSTFAGITDILPVGIAELGLPDVVQPPAPAAVPAVCTGGLLSIDGRPIDVEVTGGTSAALAGRQLSLRPCGNSAGGIRLGPGSHTVVTSPRLPSGWSIDQLWLESAAGGAAATGADTARTTAAIRPPAPNAVIVDGQSRTSLTVSVRTSGRPFWLVLGQSFDSGWSATLANGRSLGPPQLIDAFANGWYVSAGAPGVMVVHLTWDPQTVIWAALGVSGASLVVCILLAFVPETVALRRRRPGGAARGTPPTPAPVRSGPASWRTLAGWPDRPAGGAVPAWPSLVTAAVAWGAVTAFVTRPLTGVAAAVAAVVVGRWAAGRALCRAAAMAALFSVGVYAVYQQVSHNYWPTIDWPADLSSANDIAWVGLALLGSDVVGGALRMRSQRAVYAGPEMGSKR